MSQPDPYRSGARVTPLFQGEGLVIPITIADGAGNAITTYTGGEALATEVWPGGNRAAAFAAATTWVSAPAGTAQITITASQSAALGLGRYEVYATLTASMADPVAVYLGQIEVLATPGTEAAVPVYTTYQDLLDHAPWLGDLAVPEQEAGFLRQQGLAREWLDEILINRYSYGDTAPMIGSPGFGLWSLFAGGIDFAPSKWIRDQLAANVLMVRGKVREALAKKALAYICKPQLGKQGDISFRQLAREFAFEASNLIKATRCELDLNGDGYADIIIDCGATSLR